MLSCPVCYWQSRCFGTHLMMKFRISFEWLIGKVSTLVIKVTLLGRVMEGLCSPVGLGITLSPGLWSRFVGLAWLWSLLVNISPSIRNHSAYRRTVLQGPLPRRNKKISEKAWTVRSIELVDEKKSPVMAESVQEVIQASCEQATNVTCRFIRVGMYWVILCYLLEYIHLSIECFLLLMLEWNKYV